MDALTVEDLLPLEEFAGRRREFFAAHQRYLDRYRRVRLGPRAALVVENRQTLWFRVQEIVRVARLADPARLQQELDLYNRLLPGPQQLQAALVIHVTDESKLTEELAPWRELRGDQLTLRAGGSRVAAELVTCRPEDHCIGAAHWVQFTLSKAARAELADFRQPASFALELPAYQHEGPSLSEDVRQSLLDDLQLSDRDG